MRLRHTLHVEKLLVGCFLLYHLFPNCCSTGDTHTCLQVVKTILNSHSYSFDFFLIRTVLSFVHRECPPRDDTLFHIPLA
ncbi:uncharacterized protein B0T23DRAFT_387962 [Neurospora hispaniola]|uniref:Secreted protein n=1 Tax=Neurospora hispaniola TaxID=588809 RepID=A0AAJ0MMQ4_9PEZI|nr:hypothetical protein B0T23DRAFT_387962 [Neurospora hispaniola]